MHGNMDTADWIVFCYCAVLMVIGVYAAWSLNREKNRSRGPFHGNHDERVPE